MTIVFTIKPLRGWWRRWEWTAATSQGRRVAISAAGFATPWSARRSLDRLTRRLAGGAYRRGTGGAKPNALIWSIDTSMRDTIGGAMAYSARTYANAGAAGRAAMAFVEAVAAGRYLIVTERAGAAAGKGKTA